MSVTNSDVRMEFWRTRSSYNVRYHVETGPIEDSYSRPQEGDNLSKVFLAVRRRMDEGFPITTFALDEEGLEGFDRKLLELVVEDHNYRAIDNQMRTLDATKAGLNRKMAMHVPEKVHFGP